MFGKTDTGEFVVLPGKNNLFTTRDHEIEIAFCGECCWGCEHRSPNPGCRKKDEFLEIDAWLGLLVPEAKIFSTSLGLYCE